VQEQRFFAESKDVSGKTHQYNPFDNKSDSYGRYPDSKHQTSVYGEVHLQGKRDSQEDGTLFVQLTSQPKLTPQQVAERLWSTIKIVDDLVKKERAGEGEGTTVCVACLHQGHLITANLADSVLFALLLNSEDKLSGVARLTDNLHHPDDPHELNRIKSQGGVVFDGRVNSNLGVARAIGDHDYNQSGEVITADAALGIYSLNHLQTVLNLHNESVGKLKFIMSCDGFTEAADILKIEHHEYLKISFNTIKDRTFNIDFNESYLALALGRKAIEDGSGDNVSVSVLTYEPDITNTCYFAIFDGHGGQNVVNLVVKNFVHIFNKQLSLTEEAYQQQAFSIQNNKANFLRDNESVVKVVSPDRVAKDEPKTDFEFSH
jgi:integrin-linked kinase-associated serine/threonine phosphatase 2C